MNLRTAAILSVLMSAVMVAGTVTPQVAAAAVVAEGEPSVVITSPVDGSLVSNLVQITAEASEGTTQVVFSVSTDAGVTWTQLAVDTAPSDGWTASWQSDPYSGSATFLATASDGASETSDEAIVTVDNSPPAVSIDVSRPAFSPNRDGRRDSIVLTATSDEPAELTIEVLDREGDVRRTWSSPSMATRFAVKWGGRDLRGVLQDGPYLIHLEGVDRVGLRGEASRRVTIDTRPPRIRSLQIGPRLFKKSGTLSARFRLGDPTQPLKIQLQIRDRLGVIRRIAHQGGSEGTIRYRTRYRGGRPLYPGLYSARLRVVDGAGNVNLSRHHLWRMHQPVPARVFNRLDGVGRRVALTFDDCNHSSAWSSILRTLAAFRVKASFFCSGQQISADREVARRAVQQGHAIGAHGWDHALLVGRSRSETEWRIKADARLWWDIAKDTTAPFYRPAYGGFDANVLAAAGATGHGRVVMWDVDSLDYASPSSDAVTRRVVNDTRPGSIVLLHVLDKTATALPAILRGLSDRRLKPVDLHQFFRAGGYR